MNERASVGLLILSLSLGVTLATGVAVAQQTMLVNPADLTQPLAKSWPTYSGDYSGKRYSALVQIDRSTVRQLTLAWTARVNPALRTGAASSAFSAAGGMVTVQGGEGTGDFPLQTPGIKGTVLQVDGVLYVTAPDHAWALDARDGTELWHYFWKTRGGTHIASRGAALWKNSLLFETPDNYLVSLDARTGKELWHVPIASFEEQYFSTMAPIIIGDLVLVGTGNDSDMPGFLQAFDPATGKLIWKFYTTPQNPGDPGLDTWPNLEAARHGGGQVWLPGVYDPETDYYIFGTGNPTPGYTGVARPGDNLYTCSLLAVKVSTAARNGYFFTVDRVTGEHLVTQAYGATMNWSLGVRPSGSPEPNPAKEATIPGALVSPIEGGVVNWQPPAFNPEYGLFYSHENNGFNILYLTDPDPRGSMGLGGKRVAIVGFDNNAIQAIDYRTGKPAWRHVWAGSGGVGTGILATASGLVFTGDGNGNLVAFDGKTGELLWHTRIGNISNGPQTWELDGRQHLLVAVNDQLYDFVLY